MNTEGMIIDFNGFLLNDTFIIKEYAYCLFNTTTGEKNTLQESESFIHRVGMPSENELSYHLLPQSYDMYFEQYGIQWLKGTQTNGAVKSHLRGIAKIVSKIFLRNKNQEKWFKNFVGYDETFQSSIICLDDLGFLFDPKQSTFCEYHDYSYRNNCAKDNFKIMYDWLIESKLYMSKRRDNMNMVVDFSVHYMPYRTFTIKEFACYKLDFNARCKGEGGDKYIARFIKSPTTNDPDLKTFYDMSYQKYLYYNGTNEDNTNCEFDDAQKTLKKLFLDATYVYVKNYNKEILLTSFITDLYACNCNLKIIRLDEFGYDLNPEFLNICNNHIDNIEGGKTYCAIDNATKMLEWLRSHKMFLAENRNRHFNNIYKFVPMKKVKCYKYETENDETEKERLERLKEVSAEEME